MALDMARASMDKAINHMESELTKIRAGKAHPAMLDSVMVEYYGSMTPLSQVSNINSSDARTLTVQAWEKSMLDPIATAIINANLGLNPMNNGESILINIPPLTEERRKDMIRLVRHEAEGGRVAIRNIRRDAISDVKDLLKEKMIGEDDERRAEEEIQGITDKHIATIDEMLAGKESELMEI